MFPLIRSLSSDKISLRFIALGKIYFSNNLKFGLSNISIHYSICIIADITIMLYTVIMFIGYLMQLWMIPQRNFCKLTMSSIVKTILYYLCVTWYAVRSRFKYSRECDVRNYNWLYILLSIFHILELVRLSCFISLFCLYTRNRSVIHSRLL